MLDKNKCLQSITNISQYIEKIVETYPLSTIGNDKFEHAVHL